MNRDENVGREVALPPRIHNAGGDRWIAPEEASSGGTWIATNDRGVTLALLNAHPPASLVPSPERLLSRGLLIPDLIRIRSREAVADRLSKMELVRFRPFRLVAIFPQEPWLAVYGWDGRSLISEPRQWSLQQVFSSGKSDELATDARSATKRLLRQEEDEDELAWTRRLHSSHLPEAGAFSYCVHRPDARTVSYTEVFVGDAIEMSYHGCSPCELQSSAGFSTRLAINQYLPKT